jgi:purine-binding chemotaxis protein CheW
MKDYDDDHDSLELEECRRILKTRAKALARETSERKHTEEHLQVVEFMVAHERYGIESINIREVCPLRDFTAVPCTPPFVLGIINVRGQIVSVVDLRKFFDLPEKGLSDLNRAIILHHAEMEFAILADLINGVRYVPLSGIQPSLPTLTGIRLEYLKGVTTDGMVILDANKILLDKGIVVQESVEA